MKKQRKILLILALLILVIAFLVVSAILIPYYTGEENLMRAIAKVLFEFVNIFG